MARFTPTREAYIPQGAIKVSDKLTGAVAYVFSNSKGMPAAMVFTAKAVRPIWHYRFQTPEKREETVKAFFAKLRAQVQAKQEAKGKSKAAAIAMASTLEVGDIFHYSFGYDETHHCFVEIVEIKGRMATVRPISKASEDLGYDYRHRCAPQSGVYTGEPTRHLIQDGFIRIGHYYATKWNTATVAGVKVGPAYVGGGCH